MLSMTTQTLCPLFIAGVFTLSVAATVEAGSRHEAIIVSPAAIAPAPTQALTVSGRTFVPLHSTLLGQGGLKNLNLSATLSVHNPSSRNALAVEQIIYRDGSGRLIETYINEPIILRPYGSLQVLIAQNDLRGGIGASFTIDWSTTAGSEEPLIEALMTGQSGTQGFSFLSPGKRVSRSD